MPTDISQARARAFPDDALRAPPREGKRSPSRSSRKTVSPMSRLLAAVPFPRLSTGAVVGCAAFCALMTGVVVNALYLQTDKHSAPMFPPEAAAGAASPGQRANVRVAATPAPAPRAAVAAEAAVAPPLPAPRPPMREITGSLGRQPDGVEALLSGAASPRRAAPTREADSPAVAPAPKKPVVAVPVRPQPTKAVAEHRRAAAPKPAAAKPAAAKPAAAKPVAAKPAADKPITALARDKSNSTAVTSAISDEMRRKLAAISGAPVKARPAKPAADDEE